MIRVLIPLMALGLGVLSPGCAPQLAPGETGPKTSIEVENRNFLDMHVYVLRGSQRLRLGQVPGGGRRTFTIPEYIVTGAPSLRFLADPIGGTRGPITREMSVFPGDRVQLIIPAR